MFEIAAMALYGVFEYTRRERLHKRLLALIEAGEPLSEEPKIPTVWRLTGLTTVTLLLLAAVTAIIILSPSIHHYGAILRTAALILALALMALVPMTIRAFVTYMKSKETK
jgi:membrane protein YdbS with pleckstrin-like domain